MKASVGSVGLYTKAVPTPKTFPMKRVRHHRLPLTTLSTSAIACDCIVYFSLAISVAWTVVDKISSNEHIILN